jgi:hypothetical protein
MDDVEDKGAFCDVLTKIAKILGHMLIAAVVLGD